MNIIFVFRVNLFIGIIIIVREFDREVMDIYKFEIIVYKYLLLIGQLYIDNVIICVCVMDVNDVCFYFLKEVYMLEFDEENFFGVVLMIINVNDSDQGVNFCLLYSIILGNNSIISINSFIGEMIVLIFFDFEKVW